MGIQASVMCRCYALGQTSPCPYPEALQADPAAMPSLRLDFDDLDEAAEAQERFLAWLERCCPHPRMEQRREFIASWRGYRRFVEALEQLGEDAFPLLYEQLPEGQDGVTPAELAQPMLEELAQFEAGQTSLRQIVLFDDERGQIISMGSDVLKGALALDRLTGYDLGFDDLGFFVRDRLELNRLLFRARHVEQRLLSAEDLEVEYIDRDSGQSFRCRAAFGPRTTDADGFVRMAFLRFSVQEQPMATGRFDYILQPLRRILQAAHETGHPVRWH
ncbi:MAG: hypothetical protein NZ750_02965 [Anaerolineae bacterium]|nr:hypothetical protein [Anaerolineae bacterium]MDW8173359.1 hypothetical protein [Anaerolineae bacterium]